MAYSSWEIADKQIELSNKETDTRLRWTAETEENSKYRVLSRTDTNFLQLWVRHSASEYRGIGKNFLEDYYDVTNPVESATAVDHVIPRSRFKDQWPDGVAVVYFIPSGVNSSWGAGCERGSKSRHLKIRVGITLVTVTKSLEIRGTANSKIGHIRDVAEEVFRENMISKQYENEPYNNYTEIEKPTDELGGAMGVPDSTLKPK